MLKETRHDYILNEVRIRNRVLLSDIAKHLQVSEDTIRRDLKELDKQGKLKKVHGGAIAKSFTPFSFHQDEIYDHDKKSIIGSKALPFLKDGQLILITGGTTNLEFVSLIPEKIHLTFFTPSILIAMQLSKHPTVETILIGGRISKDAQVTLGTEAINTLNQINADVCFLGMGHLDANFGLSEFDREVVQLKQAMVRNSKKTVLLTLSAKLNSIQRYKICDTTAIHTLITELDPSDPSLDQYRNKGIEII